MSYESSNNPLTKRNSFYSPHEEEKEANKGNISLDFEENENDSPRIEKVDDGSPKIGRNADRENPVDPQQLISMSTQGGFRDEVQFLSIYQATEIEAQAFDENI